MVSTTPANTTIPHRPNHTVAVNGWKHDIIKVVKGGGGGEGK
jgi:hypothetical protein